MYKLDLPFDLTEKAAVERRRRAEKERQGRIFNSKFRQISVDKETLDEQVKDRNWLEELEKKRENAFAQDAIRNDKIAMLLERRQQFDERENNRALNEFRSLHQKPSSQREWDLNDPDFLKKDVPARVSDDDPRCGVSSLQKFSGEDLNSRARIQFQKEQLREWSRIQQEEKNRAEKQQKLADRLFDEKQNQLDQRGIELERAEQECRRAINQSIENYNDALFRETQQRRALKKRQEDYENFSEMAMMITSDLLTENPQQSLSQFGPHRVVPDRWKGMNEDQLNQIRQQQQKQIEEKKRRDEEEEKLQNEFEQRRIVEAKVGLLIEKQIEREKRDFQNDLSKQNQRLAIEQENVKKYFDRVVYTNQPTAAYFSQFNTNSR